MSGIGRYDDPLAEWPTDQLTSGLHVLGLARAGVLFLYDSVPLGVWTREQSGATERLGPFDSAVTRLMITQDVLGLGSGCTLRDEDGDPCWVYEVITTSNTDDVAERISFVLHHWKNDSGERGIR